MKLRMVTGGFLVLVGLAAVVFGAAFVKGPLYFWLDGFAADNVQLHAITVGVSALVIGAVTMASARWRPGPSKA